MKPMEVTVRSWIPADDVVSWTQYWSEYIIAESYNSIVKIIKYNMQHWQMNEIDLTLDSQQVSYCEHCEKKR